MSEFLPFTRPSIDETTIADVANVLRSGWITSGPKVQAFEAALSEFPERAQFEACDRVGLCGIRRSRKVDHISAEPGAESSMYLSAPAGVRGSRREAEVEAARPGVWRRNPFLRRRGRGLERARILRSLTKAALLWLMRGGIQAFIKAKNKPAEAG